jgi:hypothetical protein
LVNPDAGFVDGGPFVYGYAWQGNGMGATPIFVLATANVNIVDGGSSFCDGGNFCDGGSPFIWVNLYTGDAGPSCLADGGPISFTYDAGPLILTQCDGGMSQGCMATYTVGINDGGPLYWDAGPQCLAQYGGQDPAFGASNPGDAIGVGFCITYNAGSGAPILCVPQQVNADVTTLECNSN